MDLGSADKILDFAIRKEEDAAKLYTDLAARMDRPYMKKTFEGFAREELGHKAKLVSVREGRKLVLSDEKVQDLKISDHLVDVRPSAELDYQQALILAMKEEKAAYKLYSDLAEAADDTGLKELFLALAQEEAKHKLRFEIEYDEQILSEN
ncbi:MAG: ferritin family protein [candidate division Zixibacteria bacterium]|nr:ferritin family protein [candidate division Zixibacteria bacterium]